MNDLIYYLSGTEAMATILNQLNNEEIQLEELLTKNKPTDQEKLFIDEFNSRYDEASFGLGLHPDDDYQQISEYVLEGLYELYNIN